MAAENDFEEIDFRKWCQRPDSEMTVIERIATTLETAILTDGPIDTNGDGYLGAAEDAYRGAETLLRISFNNRLGKPKH